jgi:hypothetical protein
MWRFIKIGRATAKHAQTLKGLGYTVLFSQGGTPALAVWAGAAPAQFNVTREAIASLVANRGSLSYKTVGVLPDGRRAQGLALCWALDRLERGLSALVMSDERP